MKKSVFVTLVALSMLSLGSCCRFMDCCFDDPCNPCEIFQGCSNQSNCSSQKRECKKVDRSCNPCSSKSSCSQNVEQSGCSYTPSCKPCNPCGNKEQKKGFSFFKKKSSSSSQSSQVETPSNNIQEANSSNSSSSNTNFSGKCSSGSCGGN